MLIALLYNILNYSRCSPFKRSPYVHLRAFPPLDAQPVIGIAVTLVRDLPADLYEELVRHPYAVDHH